MADLSDWNKKRIEAYIESGLSTLEAMDKVEKEELIRFAKLTFYIPMVIALSCSCVFCFFNFIEKK
jgi:hypothetical protein